MVRGEWNGRYHPDSNAFCAENKREGGKAGKSRQVKGKEKRIRTTTKGVVLGQSEDSGV